MKNEFEENGIVFDRVSEAFNINQLEDLRLMHRMAQDALASNRQIKWIVIETSAYLYHNKWPHGKPPPPAERTPKDPNLCPQGHVKDKRNVHGYRYCSICHKESSVKSRESKPAPNRQINIENIYY